MSTRPAVTLVLALAASTATAASGFASPPSNARIVNDHVHIWKPTTPGNLQTTSVTQTSVTIAWSASRASAGLAGYNLYLNGTSDGTTLATSATFAGLSCATTVELGVNAYDTRGRTSSTATVTATTGACPGGPPFDTQSPTVPSNLQATATTASSIAVSWDASTDDTGVTGYGVYENGSLIATPTSLGDTLTGLACGTPYTIAVDAADAAGNRSAQASIVASTSACPPAPPPTGSMTGTHWAAVSDMPALKQLGYGFDVTTVDPADPSSWPAVINAAQANGLKLIIGAYPEPYSEVNGQWTISAAGVSFLNYLASHSSVVLAVFVYNEPYWVNPTSGATSSCGALSAADLRGLRTAIQSVWTGAKIYEDLGQPSAWAPGGSLYNAYPCIGSKYADQTGVADYVGVWDYPFETDGYQKTRALATLSRETSYVINSMHAIPVWLNQSHATGNLVFPTQAQLLDWNCSVRAALPPGSLLSWYVWRQSLYTDTLSQHPEDWSSTTAAACA
jgi:chitodextrinase